MPYMRLNNFGFTSKCRLGFPFHETHETHYSFPNLVPAQYKGDKSRASGTMNRGQVGLCNLPRFDGDLDICFKLNTFSGQIFTGVSSTVQVRAFPSLGVFCYDAQDYALEPRSG